MKNSLRALSPMFFLITGMVVQAQTYNFPTVYNPASCASTYEINTTVRLDSVGITNIYFDDGTTGSFAFEAFVSYENTVVNSTLPAGNFFTYEITLYSDNPNLSTPSLTNNIGSVPLVTSSSGGLGSQNNPTYIASASALGLSQGQYYSTPSLLDELGYDSATIHMNLPCLDTLLRANGTVPLSVHWSRLTAKATGSRVALNWQTFREQNNAGFYIERSIDAVQWNTVAMHPGKAKDGISNAPLFYSYTIDEATDGTYYYRIAQKSADGATARSNIVSAFISNRQGNMYAYPNPAKNELYLSGIPEYAGFSVSDLSGRVVLKGHYNKNIELAGLHPGIYWVSCQGKKAKIIVDPASY